jgi:hypothetical protein
VRDKVSFGANWVRGGGYLPQHGVGGTAAVTDRLGTLRSDEAGGGGLAEWPAITHGDQGIRVNVLGPRAVRNAMTAGNEDGVASIDG